MDGSEDPAERKNHQGTPFIAGITMVSVAHHRPGGPRGLRKRRSLYGDHQYVLRAEFSGVVAGIDLGLKAVVATFKDPTLGSKCGQRLSPGQNAQRMSTLRQSHADESPDAPAPTIPIFITVLDTPSQSDTIHPEQYRCLHGRSMKGRRLKVFQAHLGFTTPSLQRRRRKRRLKPGAQVEANSPKALRASDRPDSGEEGVD